MQGIILCKKRLLIVCLLIASGTSQASMNSLSKQDGTTLSIAQTVIPNEVHHVKTRAVPKPNLIKVLPKAKRQQQQLLSKYATDDDYDDDYDDLDIFVGYRRPKLVDDTDDDQISPYIADRLAQARELALARYREIRDQNI